MGVKNVIAEPDWLKSERIGKCPFCYKSLGKIEILKRKNKRKCKCNNCGKEIDERFIVR